VQWEEYAMLKAMSFTTVLCWLGILLSTTLMTDLQPARAAHQGAASVNGFYATSKAEFDKRYASTKYVPIKYTSLPSGSYYIAAAWYWSGAAKNVPFYVVLRHHNGATINVAGPYTYKLISGNSATYFPSVGKPFADGTYDLDLVIDYALAATTSVTVGGSGGATVGGVTISAFVVTTLPALNAWIKQTGLYPLPKLQTHFPAGITETEFCYIFKGGTSNVTTYQVVVHGPNGLELKGNGSSVFKLTNGGAYVHRAAPQHLAYPSGAYTAVLLVNGTQASQVAFTIS
jgi:hypothetical protein